MNGSIILGKLYMLKDIKDGNMVKEIEKVEKVKGWMKN